MTDYWFWARGTTEPFGNNMLSNSVGKMLPKHVVQVEIPHSASISINNAKGDPLAPSGSNCANQIVDWLDTTVADLLPGDRYAVSGYSLGAVGIGRWLNRGQYDHRLLAAGQLASPVRQGGTNTGNWIDPTRSGIYRMWQKPSDLYRATIPPLYEIANANDVMTSCPEKSPLPEFAGPVMAAELGKPWELIAQLENGGIDSIVRDLTNVQNWFSKDWWGWGKQLQQFATTEHTHAYFRNEWVLPNGSKGTGVACLAANLSKHFNN